MLQNKVVVSVVAEVSRGKSTLINALIFKDNILENKNGETTVQNFRISYKKNTDVLSQKEIVSKHNAKNLTKSKEKKLYTNNSFLKNAIVLDTPGFNSTNEEYIQPKINEALKITDIVVFVIDVQKGVTQEEIQQIENIKEHGIDKIIVVVNKKDRLLDNEEDIEQHIQKIEKTISKYIKLYQPIFLISAKMALIGYVSDNQEKIEESGVSFLEGELENFLTTKLKVIKKQNKILKEYKDIKNRVKDFINDYEDLIDTILFIIESDIESFPYYFVRYPKTSFGDFDVEAFSRASKLFTENLSLYDDSFREVSNLCSKFSNSCANLNINYKNLTKKQLSYQLSSLSLEILNFNKKLVSIQINCTNISILINLCIFNIEKKDFIDKTDKLYQTNMMNAKYINDRIEELQQKFKELKDEC